MSGSQAGSIGRIVKQNVGKMKDRVRGVTSRDRGNKTSWRTSKAMSHVSMHSLIKIGSFKLQKLVDNKCELSA